MRKTLLWVFALVGLLASWSYQPANAQVPHLLWQCVAPSASRPSGADCPVSAAYPIPTTSVAGGASLPAGTNNIGNVGSISQYPNTAVPITASASVAASANTATLAGTAGKTTYVCGFTVSGLGATAATVSTVTVANTVTGSLIYYEPIPAGVTVGLSPLVVPFNPCVPASAANTAVTVTVSSPGAGNTNIAVSATGYQL